MLWVLKNPHPCCDIVKGPLTTAVLREENPGTKLSLDAFIFTRPHFHAKWSESTDQVPHVNWRQLHGPILYIPIFLYLST